LNPAEESRNGMNLPETNHTKCVVRLDCETSNTLFEELADWNEHLKRKNVSLSRDLGGPKP